MASFRNPNPLVDNSDIEWLSYTSDKSYLEIDVGLSAGNAKIGRRAKQMQFWNDVIYQVAEQPWAGILRKLWAVGSERGPEVDSAEHSSVWRRPQYVTFFGHQFGAQGFCLLALGEPPQ